MAMDITGIFNENEFYTHHYLSAILENDLKEVFTRWLLLFGFAQIILLDRTKWHEKRLLRFDVREILDRREPSTLHASIQTLFHLLYNGFQPTELDLLAKPDHHTFRISPLRSHLFDPAQTPILSRVKIRNFVLQQGIGIVKPVFG